MSKLQESQVQTERSQILSEKHTPVDGHKPTQSKIKAIQEMPAPQCNRQVQSFIGMVNYLSKFSARLSGACIEPIRHLCKEKVPFNLGTRA